jgi:lipoprotein LprG
MQAMQTRRRLFAVVLALLALSFIPLAGCGSKQSSAPLPDAATLLKESAETTRDLKSVHLELTVKGAIPHLPVKTLTGDLTNIPDVAAKGHTKVTLGGDVVDADFVILEGTLYASLDPGVWNNFGPASSLYDASVILNPDVGLANVLGNFVSPKAEARETINGVQTIRITGQGSADAANKMVPNITSGGSVPGTTWIREDGNHDLVEAKLEPSPSNSIQLTLSNWNVPVVVTKPAGV